MNQTIKAKNHLYDGWIYRKFIDPSLIGIRRRISKHIPDGSSVIDIGCGTGNQLFYLSPQISRGLGVELSETMINTCEQQIRTNGIQNCQFQLADASHLPQLTDQSFDFAISSLVIHEMPENIRIPVLKEMGRLGKTIVLADWIFPQPSPWKNASTHVVERMAGKQHYAGFRSYLKSGGMPALLNEVGFDIQETEITSKGTMQLWVCRPH